MGSGGDLAVSLATDTWTAFTDNEGWERVGEHVRLSLTALVLAGIVGTILGIASAKAGRAGAYLVNASAFVARLVPTFAAMALIVAFSSVGFRPALVALVILGIPPVLLNVATGIAGADRGSVTAARGMGMTGLQTLARVELPLAVPYLYTGLRTASVMIIATAALAGTVGAGGLGVTIIAGFSNGQTDVLLAGAIPVTLLTLAGEGILAAAQYLSTPTGLRRARHQARFGGRTT
jgi:osmoprotectant transport system permease protein